MRASRQLADEYSAKRDAYAEHWSPVIRPMALPLLPELRLRDVRRVLDVGAGTGAFLADLEAAAPNACVLGVDTAIGMLRAARRTGAGRLAVADAQDLAISSRAIDAVIAIFVLFHLPDPLRGLRECHRVLRHGGCIGVTTWGRDAETPGLAIWREELERAGAPPDPRDARVMQQALMDTPDKLRRLLDAAGFNAVRTWACTAVHQFTVDGLIAVQTGCGMPARRLAQLPESQRAQCEARVRARLACLGREQLVYRPEVLFACGRASRLL
jgi:ubiquinone/menaquinone biosynthesis C-methylase UbiE